MAQQLQKQGKMAGFVNYRMRATMKDGRQLVGQMLAFDKYMNLVFADCEEFRKVKRKPKGGAPGATQMVETEEKRMLGLAIIRGAHVVCCSVDGEPPADPGARLGQSAPGGAGGAPAAMPLGPGISRPAGRGQGVGLQGPAPGVGGPGFPGFPGAPPGAFPPRGGPPAGPPAGFPPPGFAPPGFAPNAGLPPPPGGRGFQPPGGFPGR